MRIPCVLAPNNARPLLLPQVHSVMAALMDRLARYAGAPAAGPSAGGAAAGGSGAGGRGGAPDPRVVEQLAAIGAFDKFKQAISQVGSCRKRGLRGSARTGWWVWRRPTRREGGLR